MMGALPDGIVGRSSEPSRQLFDYLFGMRNAFRGLKAFPERSKVVVEALANVRGVLDGQDVDEVGYSRVLRRNDQEVVVFSDHHIMPSAHRQGAVWRANRGPYVKLLHHYQKQGHLIVENGDVEDLVIMEPGKTYRAYRDVFSRMGAKKDDPVFLLERFREDPVELEQVMQNARLRYRKEQLRQILYDEKNQA